MPKVSVLICVYNDKKNIGRALDSILSQTFQDFEIVVVNDGSTDGTDEVLRSYVKRDNRIKIITQANSGTTQAANNGLALCRGKYIARLDSDDFSYPYRLQTEIDILESDENIGLVGGGCDIVDSSGRVVGTRNISTKHPAKTLKHRCIFQQSDVMFRKDYVLSLGGYRGKFRNAQDYDLWLRISEKHQIVKLNKILGAWTLNAGGYTLSRKEEQRKEVEVIKKMARNRRAGKDDQYDLYAPVAKLLTHRKDISDSQYNSIIASLLLKDLKKKEAKLVIKNIPFSMKKVVFSTVSSMPVLLLKNAFTLREYYLNHR